MTISKVLLIKRKIYVGRTTDDVRRDLLFSISCFWKTVDLYMVKKYENFTMKQPK